MVWPFKKKKEKDKTQDKANKDDNLTMLSSNEVRIVIVSGVEDTPVQEHSFIARIEVDKLDKVKYMINEDFDFKELYPERDDNYEFSIPGKTIEQKKNWLKKEIDKLKNKLANYKANITKEYNEKDLEFKIKIYENRLLEFDRGLDNRQGSPVFIGQKGFKTFFFFRTSGELIPLRWDLKGLSIYKDIAYKKKQSVVAYQNLLSKYNHKIKKMIESTTLWLMLILIVWTVGLIIGSGYLFNKYNDFNKMYDEANIAKLKTQAESSVLWCTDVLKEQLTIVKNLTELNKENLELQNKFIVSKNGQTQTRAPTNTS